MPLSSDFIHALQKSIRGEVRVDPTTRLLYSTDASIYQIEPLGVAFPRELDELNAIVEIAAAHNVPVLARGAGSSLAGQAIGEALIVDCSRHLYRQIDIDSEEMTAVVEPGVVLNNLNRAAAAYGLQFGPDPASAERATMGGSLANNATGAHSIVYGMAADHLLAAEVVLSDGSLAKFEEVSLELQSAIGNRQSAICAAALHIREHYADAIRAHWPRTWRRASGYSLNYLLPWSPSIPPGWQSDYNPTAIYNPQSAIQNPQSKIRNPQSAIRNPQSAIGSPQSAIYNPQSTINLAPLLCGSEGTLAIIRRAVVRLVPKPRHTLLGVLAYPDSAAACDAVPRLLERHPSAVELIPWELIALARGVPAYAHQLSFLTPLIDEQSGGAPPEVGGRRRGAVLLVVEFAGDNPAHLRERAKALRADVLLAETAEAQQRIWSVRKMGLGILQSQPGDLKPISFIEDLAVPVERLGEFVREMERITTAHGTRAETYAHASAGCLHIRPLLNLKTAQGRINLRAIASQAVDLTLRLGGAVSGEHGDGLARSEWLERAYGAEIMAAFRELKNAADPQGILNPGKILDAPPMDRNLRYGENYCPQAWTPALDFSSQGGLVAAVEQCNGAGVCRKDDGVMCPSFQATGDEMFSTRGRANLLRALLISHPKSVDSIEGSVHAAIDLCLACKGCKAECPSAVDIAKLKYEFANEYYKTHRRRLRDVLFGYISLLARLGRPFAFILHPLMENTLARQLGERWLGLAARRQLPRFEKARSDLSRNYKQADVFLLRDAFNHYFYPETERAALCVLEAVGCRVGILPVIGAGRTLISKGFLEAALRHARCVVDAIVRLDPQGKMPIIGLEPSEIYTLRDEYLDLLPGDEQVKSLAERAWMIDEFLIRPGADGLMRIAKLAAHDQPSPHEPVSATVYPSFAICHPQSVIRNLSSAIRHLPSAIGHLPSAIANHQSAIHHLSSAIRNLQSEIPNPQSPIPNLQSKILLHGHCYQKALPPAADGYPTGVAATAAMLEAVGYQVSVIEAGCCGMAGAFGYEAEHYELSMKIGELALFPAVRAAGDEVIIAASGISCQSQIEEGARKKAVHPIQLVERCL